MKIKILFVIVIIVFIQESYSADSTKSKFGLTIGGGITSGSFYKTDLGFTTSLGYYFKNNNYLGILFNSTYINNTDIHDTETIYSEIIGGGLSWRYRGWGNDNYFSVSPGIVVGYWTKDYFSNKYSPPYYYSELRIFEHYYIGPTILTKIGYKHVYLAMDNTLLVNKDIYYLFSLGIEFKNIDLKTLWDIINILSWFNRSPL